MNRGATFCRPFRGDNGLDEGVGPTARQEAAPTDDPTYGR
jgi:hypothetical protein